MLPHLVRHLGGEAGPYVVHRQHDPQHPKLRVQHLPEQVQGVAELAQTFEGIVLALNRYQHRVGRRQAVHGQQPK